MDGRKDRRRIDGRWGRSGPLGEVHLQVLLGDATRLTAALDPGEVHAMLLGHLAHQGTALGS
jgi:hypothetical protein